MSLNTGYFAAYNQRHKRATLAYRLSLHNHHQQHTSYSKCSRSSSMESFSGKNSFLPSITTMNGDQNGAHRPYRRNDFANNHLFVAKQKLARFFLDEPSMNSQPDSELIHLFDQQESKQKHRKNNRNKRQEYNSDSKSSLSFDRDIHLSVVNLTMRPTVPLSPNRDSFPAMPNRRKHAINLQATTPRTSIEWTNPAISHNTQSKFKYTFEDDLKANTIINELIDSNPEIVNSTINPIDLSVLYVKSIIPSSTPSHR